jgi:hypothetical protein
LAALKSDNHRQAVTKATANPGKGYKAREAIKVMEPFEFRHRKSMAVFSTEGKKESPGIYGLSGASEPKIAH